MALIGQAVSEEKIFENGGRRTDGRRTTDGRTTKHGYTISSPCEPDGSGELKIHEDFMKTLENESPSYSTVKKWAAEFKLGRESIDDDPRSGHPKDATTDENVEIVHILVMCDRRRD